MADYSNQGVTYSASMSSVAIGTDTIGVKKVKPPGVDQQIEPGYELGTATRVTFIEGRVDVDNAAVTIRAAEWERWTDANPTWASTEYPISISLRGRGIDTRTYNMPRSRIKSVKPTELDIDSTSEALVEIEIMPLDVRTGDKRWIQ